MRVRLTLLGLNGQYAEPIYLGTLPELVQNELGDHPVRFSDDEWKIIKGSSDLYVSTASPS